MIALSFTESYSNTSMVKVGIIGASGYTGAELLRLCAQHPEVEVVAATGDSQAGTLASHLYPSVAAAYPNLVFEEFSVERFTGLDVVFLGIPHEAALEIAPQLTGKVGCIIDLSAAYRLKDASLYPTWYGFTHTQPELLAKAVYGLPELYRSELVGASLIATPGCYVTAASLALTPLVRSGIVQQTGVIVDAASGVSGAGRALKHTSLFSTVDEDFTAYGLLDHRHTPEIEQVTGAQVLFTPHLAPMNRGILATCYARPAGAAPTTASLLASLATFYKDEPFIVVRPQIPSTKATLGTNCVHITARYDERTGYVMVLAALDNIAKGASGGAVQSMNVALGLAENLGLNSVGVYP
jgi:N-acetyl-gamma-glutamyl-phosphate reductase